jgi:hypothetical protein
MVSKPHTRLEYVNKITYHFQPLNEKGELSDLRDRTLAASIRLNFEHYDDHYENFIYEEAELTKEFTPLILKKYLGRLISVLPPV